MKKGERGKEDFQTLGVLGKEKTLSFKGEGRPTRALFAVRRGEERRGIPELFILSFLREGKTPPPPSKRGRVWEKG